MNAEKAEQNRDEAIVLATKFVSEMLQNQALMQTIAILIEEDQLTESKLAMLLSLLDPYYNNEKAFSNSHKTNLIRLLRNQEFLDNFGQIAQEFQVDKHVIFSLYDQLNSLQSRINSYLNSDSPEMISKLTKLHSEITINDEIKTLEDILFAIHEEFQCTRLTLPQDKSYEALDLNNLKIFYSDGKVSIGSTKNNPNQIEFNLGHNLCAIQIRNSGQIVVFMDIDWPGIMLPVAF